MARKFGVTRAASDNTIAGSPVQEEDAAMTGWGSGDVNIAITVPAQLSPAPIQEQHKQIVVMSTLSTFPSIISRQILELSTKLREVSQ